MKVLIIYYSQSGNTMLIARHIEKGLRTVWALPSGKQTRPTCTILSTRCLIREENSVLVSIPTVPCRTCTGPS